VVSRLLVSIRQTQERCFAPGTPEKLHAGRQQAASGKAHGHCNGGKSGAGSKQLIVVAVGSVEIADEPRRIAPCRVDERVQAIVVHQFEDGRPQFAAKLNSSLTTRRFPWGIIRGL